MTRLTYIVIERQPGPSDLTILTSTGNKGVGVFELVRRYMKEEYEFKVVKKTTTLVEEGESFSIILKPTNKFTACELELKVKTENVFISQDELGFGLDMGDTVCFMKSKTGKQLKIAPTEEDIKKTTPDRVEIPNDKLEEAQARYKTGLGKKTEKKKGRHKKVKE